MAAAAGSALVGRPTYAQGSRRSADVAIVRRTLADGRVRTLCFALLFALSAYANAAGYKSAYPTLKDRLDFAHSFGTNKALRLFYGVPHDLISSGGYSAWRIVGFFSILAGAWGLLAAVAALRGEEDAGRAELVLAGIVGRGGQFADVLVAIVLSAACMWLVMLLALIAGGLEAEGSAYVALATLAPAIVFAGVGALMSQLASTRRVALELSSAALAASLAVRVIADTASGVGWLRWVTPLGWSEELRAFTGTRPAVLLAPAAVSALLFVLAGAIARRRDVGSGLLQTSDSSAPNLRLLSSPAALALREERASLAAWLAGTALYAAVIGALCTSFNSQSISTSLQREIRKLGAASITTPAGALGFYFLFFTLVTCLFVCAQVAAARREEADERLQTLFALPFGRHAWLTGRLALALAGTVALALALALVTWAAAETQHAGVSLPRMLEAGANCVPVALMFLGIGALAFALLPRAGVGIAYGLVTVAFVWDLFGSLLGAPHWVVDLTPFQHIALVPAQPLRVGATLVMLGIGAAGALAAGLVFRRRDLTGH